MDQQQQTEKPVDTESNNNNNKKRTKENDNKKEEEEETLKKPKNNNETPENIIGNLLNNNSQPLKLDNYEHILIDTDNGTTISREYKWIDKLNLEIMSIPSFLAAFPFFIMKPPFENIKEFKEHITTLFKSVKIEKENVYNYIQQYSSIYDASFLCNVKILIAPNFIKTFIIPDSNNQLIIQCFYLDKTLQTNSPEISVCKLNLNNKEIIESLNLSFNKLNNNAQYLQHTLKSQTTKQQSQQLLGSSNSSNDCSAKFLCANATLFEQLQEIHLNSSESEIPVDLEKELLRFGLYNIKIQQRIKGRSNDRFCYYAHCSSIHKEEENVFLKLSMGRLENVSLMERIVKENIRHSNISTIFRYGVISHKTLFENPYLNLLKVISPNDFSNYKLNINNSTLQSNDIYYTIQECLVKREQYLNEILKEVKLVKLLLIKLFYDCLFGVKFLNQLNIMHCDLSMQNILFRKCNFNNFQGYYHGKLLKYLKKYLNQFIIYDAVIIDLNNAHFISDSSKLRNITTNLFITEPYCPLIRSFTEHHDLFSLGIIFAEYLKFILDGNYKFNFEVGDTVGYLKEIDRYFTVDCDNNAIYGEFITIIYEKLIKKMIWDYSNYKVQEFIVMLNNICKDILNL
ncbi:hypothetical protein ABK040_007589 [Willaertia magna]